LASTATAAALLTYASFHRDLSKAKQRIAAGSKVIDTACGPIGYADAGQGPPLLMIHGAGGGFDQGLLTAQQHGIDASHYRIVAPSRFGYLQTPLPSGDATPAAQADAHACLLDALGIHGKVTVVAISAGALSAMQFAIKYPERVSSLVLLVPDSWKPPETRDPSAQDVGGNQFVMKVVLKSDFVIWAFMKLFKGMMFSFIGVPKELQQDLSEEDNKGITDVMKTILPVSQRYPGIMNDGINSGALERYELERISVPTLVIDAADMDTFPGAKYTAEHIPNAKLVAFETGGHMLIGHGAEARTAVQNFLAQR
jgi:pimeloyl-ACP methyl ester carboxylesterase